MTFVSFVRSDGIHTVVHHSLEKQNERELLHKRLINITYIWYAVRNLMYESIIELVHQRLD